MQLNTLRARPCPIKQYLASHKLSLLATLLAFLNGKLIKPINFMIKPAIKPADFMFKIQITAMWLVETACVFLIFLIATLQILMESKIHVSPAGNTRHLNFR